MKICEYKPKTLKWVCESCRHNINILGYLNLNKDKLCVFCSGKGYRVYDTIPLNRLTSTNGWIHNKTSSNYYSIEDGILSINYIK